MNSRYSSYRKPRFFVLAVTCLSAVGCVPDASSSSWDENNKQLVLRNCVAQVRQGESEIYANEYCHCVFEPVFGRWSFADLEQRESSILQSLSAEGVMDSCMRSSRMADRDDFLQRTRDAQIPAGVLGVVLGASHEELREVRPSAKQGFEGGSARLLKEDLLWNGRSFSATYFVGLSGVFSITLERPSNRAEFVGLNRELAVKYLLPPFSQDQQGVLSSERHVEGVRLLHTLHPDNSGTEIESVRISMK